jgi:hypothetical protein
MHLHGKRSSTQYLLLAVLLFVLSGRQQQVPPAATAFSPIAIQRNIVEGVGSQGNLTQFVTRTVTFICNSGDFRTTLQVGSRYIDYLCSAPVYTFKVTLVMFVPAAARKVTAEVCVVNSESDQLGSTITSRGGVAGRRRLLWSHFYENLDPRTINTLEAYSRPTSRNLLSFWDGVADFFGSGPKSLYCFSALGAFTPNDCGAGTTDSTDEARIKSLLADNRFKDELKKWLQMALDYADNQVNKFNNQTINTLAAFNKTTNLLAQQQTTLLNMNNALAANVDSRFNATAAILTQFESNLALGVNISEAISQRAAQFENATTNNFRTVRTVVDQINSAIQYMSRKSIRNFRDVYRYVRKLAAINIRTEMKTQLKRQISTQIHALIAQYENTGMWKKFLDPDFAGFPPGESTPATRTSLVDTLYLNFINTTDGLHPLGSGVDRMHSYSLKLNCNTRTVLDTLLKDAIWSDFFEFIGPVNCTNTTGEIVDNCRCWVEVHHTECTPTAGFAWSQVVSDNRQDYTIGLDNADTRCDVATRPSTVSPKVGQYGYDGYARAWEGRMIADMPTFNALLGSLCGVTGSLNAPSTRRLLHLVSLRNGRLEFETSSGSFSDKARVCAPDLDYVFDDDPQNNNVMYAMYKNYELGFKTLTTERQPQERQTFGIIPRGLTYEHVPFQYVENNDTSECWRASVTMISLDTRPVYTVFPTGFVSVVTATAYDTAPVCGEFGCTYGTPVSVDTSSVVVPTITFADVLPDAATTLIGELWTTTTPAMTSVYDVPDGAAPVHHLFRDRGVTYLGMNIPVGYNLTNSTNYNVETPQSLGGPYPDSGNLKIWLEQNVGPYDARHAIFTLDVLKREISGGKCVAEPDIPPNRLCVALERFRIHPSTNFRRLNQLAMEARDSWSYLVNSNINKDGEVIQRVFEGCPEFRFRSMANYGVQELVLLNSLPNPIRVQTHLEMLTSGCIAPADQVYNLQPRVEQSQYLIPCGSQRLTVYQIRIDGSLSICESAINTTFDSTSPTSVRQWVVAQTNTSFVANEAVAQLTDFQERTFIPLLLGVLSRVPAVIIPPETITLADDPTITNMIADYRAVLNASRAVTTTITQQSAADAIKPATDQFQITAIALQTALATQSDEINTLKEINLDLQAQIRALRNQTNITSDAIDASIRANLEEIEAIRNKQKNHDGACYDCCWCYDGIGGIFIIGPLICFFLCAIFNFFKNIFVLLIAICAIAIFCPPLVKALFRGLKRGISKWGDDDGDEENPRPIRSRRRRAPPMMMQDFPQQQQQQPQMMMPMGNNGGPVDPIMGRAGAIEGRGDDDSVSDDGAQSSSSSSSSAKSSSSSSNKKKNKRKRSKSATKRRKRGRSKSSRSIG